MGGVVIGLRQTGRLSRVGEIKGRGIFPTRWRRRKSFALQFGPQNLAYPLVTAYAAAMKLSPHCWQIAEARGRFNSRSRLPCSVCQRRPSSLLCHATAAADAFGCDLRARSPNSGPWRTPRCSRTVMHSRLPIVLLLRIVVPVMHVIADRDRAAMIPPDRVMQFHALALEVHAATVVADAVELLNRRADDGRSHAVLH